MTFLSPNFFIGNIRIGTIEGASCLNMGNNYPANFQSHKKHNQGFGSISGDHNSLEGLRSILSDPDVIDVLTNSNTDELPAVVQEMLEHQMEQNSSHQNVSINDQKK
ncbi:hypothetical protein LGQ02_04100 [Bacillus shivajii]|uniref:hypothetical protein n=1 Tax=Bacillus shivajii TaxID=1983719 RepID=UPI001CFB73B9|nr:hypothetical protein [Bacillus shivajii]UCZ53974.1 hypothetical protein LGQ02_04100 [Bacillus shivajii]